MDLSLAGYHRHAIGLGFVVMIQKTLALILSTKGKLSTFILRYNLLTERTLSNYIVQNKSRIIAM